MPLVKMRKNTRVFSARVLRSGRRIWSGPLVEVKYIRVGKDGVFDKSGGGGGAGVLGNCKENGWRVDSGLNQEMTIDKMEIDKKREPKMRELRKFGMVDSNVNGDSKWGIVYSRKRKRIDLKRVAFKLSSSVDLRYGKTYFRKQRKKKIRVEPKLDFVASNCGSRSLFSSFLNLILRYMRRSGVRLAQLSAFLLSEPIVQIYSSHGIQFLQDMTCSRCSRFCRIMGSKDFIPIFSVDCNAIPISFMYLHLSLLLKSALHPQLTVRTKCMETGKSLCIPEEEQPSSISCESPFRRIIPVEEQPSCLIYESEQASARVNTIPVCKSVKRKLEPALAPKLGLRTMQLRSGAIIRSIEMRRTSMRSRRHGIPSGAGLRRGNRAMAINKRRRKDGVPSHPKKPNAKKSTFLKKCFEHNVCTPLPASPIPVPGVHEVAEYADCKTVPFRLPDLYITHKGDEVGRVLEKKIPFYDMESDDEEWLKHFNSESCTENETIEKISENAFEKMIDTFERGIFFALDDYLDVEVAVDRCHGLAAREVLEAVHIYWISKRQKRSSALVRMFQIYERRGAEVLPKTIFRKKRSFKRQPSQLGRKKQLDFLKAIVNEREELQAQNAFNKVDEANDATHRSEELAIQKRQRAQCLTEIADLATYKATLALRIAEAAKSLYASDTLQFFLCE